jgi:hypothetical protein
VSHDTPRAEQNAKSPTVELIDCGQASKETRGFAFFLLFELGTPPFDRQLL